MSSQIIDLAYGKANFSGTLATFGVMKLNQNVDVPFKRESAATTGRRIKGADQSTPVGYLDMHGVIVSCKVEHQQGSIILLQVSWKRSGIGLRDGAVFIRLREGAPLLTVHANLPTSRENRYGESFQMFSGYGDILSPHDLKVLGVEVPRGWASSFMSPEEIKECFIVRQIRPETIPRPQLAAVATSEGIKMREIAQEPMRRIRVNKRPQ